MGLFKSLLHYGHAKAEHEFNEKADPGIQLEQVLREAQDHLAQVNAAAASVVAAMKQSELRLNRAIDTKAKLEASLQAAIKQNNTAAQQAFAIQLAGATADVDEQKSQVMANTDSANHAKTLVQEAQEQYEEVLAEKQHLTSKIATAKMEEAKNAAMSTLTDASHHDIPSMAEMEDKIDARMAAASGTSEIQGLSAQAQMLDVHHAALSSQADDIIAQMKASMGVIEAPDATAAIEAPADAEVVSKS